MRKQQQGLLGMEAATDILERGIANAQARVCKEGIGAIHVRPFWALRPAANGSTAVAKGAMKYLKDTQTSLSR